MAGSHNAKREYVARAVVDRAGIGPDGWRGVIHVMACLWSAEVLHVIRLRTANFEALCPDPPTQLEAWLSGVPRARAMTSTLVLLDPSTPIASGRRAFVGLAAARRVNARHADYADAAQALRRATSPA